MSFEAKGANSNLKYKVRYDDDLSLEWDPIDTILSNCGFEGGEKAFVLPLMPRIIYRPGEYKNLETAIDKLHEYFENPYGTIIIKVDPDVDGFTSSAMLVSWLKAMSRELVIPLDIRLVFSEGKQHGYDKEAFTATCGEDWAKDCAWAIFPDAGSDSYTINTIADMPIGPDNVLIIDHHPVEQDEDYISPNFYIVNPHNTDGGNCTLTGAGMVLKFIQAYETKYPTLLLKTYASIANHEWQDFNRTIWGHANALCALGQVADVCDLRNHETRAIVFEGIGCMNSEPSECEAYPEETRPSLMYELCLGNPFVSCHKAYATIRSLGWYIAPPINAVIRYGAMKEKRAVFDAMLWNNTDTTMYKPRRKPGENKAPEPREVTAQWDAARLCRNAKNRQDKAVREYVSTYSEWDSIRDTDCIAVIVRDPVPEKDLPLTGLIANKLTDIYKRPVLLLTRHSNGLCTGSGRGYAQSPIEDFKAALSGTECPTMLGGHANAFGIEIPEDAIAPMLSKLNKQYDGVSRSIHTVDYKLKAQDVTGSLVKQVAKNNKYFGNGIPKPVFVITDIHVQADDVISEKNGQTIQFICNGITYVKKHCGADEYAHLTQNDFQYGFGGASGALDITAIGTFELDEEGEDYIRVTYFASRSQEGF